MKLNLTLQYPDSTTSDVSIDTDPATMVGELARSLCERDPRGVLSQRDTSANTTLEHSVQGGTRTKLSPTSAIGECGLRTGDVISVVEAPEGAGRALNAATLRVISGPGGPKTFQLGTGRSTIGRSHTCDVQINDRQISQQHARVIVDDVIEIIDDYSTNGVIVAGELVPRAVVRPSDQVLLGETLVTIERTPGIDTQTSPRGTTIAFNRSPRVDAVFETDRFVAPEPPSEIKPTPFPMIALLMPVIMIGAFFLSSGGSGQAGRSMVFFIMMPMMMIGGWLENKRRAKVELKKAIEEFKQKLANLVVDLRREQDEERRVRLIQHPGNSEALNAIAQRSAWLWTRRPEHVSFGQLRLGLGRQRSLIELETGNSRNAIPELQGEVESVADGFKHIDHVPVVGDFDTCGSLGVAGPHEAARGVARGLLLQFVALHSPSEVVICAIASPRSSQDWEWIKWLPHVGSDFSPLQSPALVSSEPAAINLIAELTDLVQLRAGQKNDVGGAILPRVLVLVEDDGPFNRAKLVNLAEKGREYGVHLVWVAPLITNIPAVCRTFVEVDSITAQPSAGRVVEGELVTPVVVEPVDINQAYQHARLLSSVQDAGAVLEGIEDLPTSVSFVAEAGTELLTSSDSILERWRESNSLLLPGEKPVRTKRAATLRAFVGRTTTDGLHLDLRTHGPHALVGGTTGAGKSEFLQAWILGMAIAHSPQRVNFLFVDYKGGAAFADCVNLPHTVGLVTDLSPHLVKRALISLNAELTYREHFLNQWKVKDLIELEQSGEVEPPPSLVIVVDEFAALVQEVPEFIDGVVNVAQRGRSLGLHLILATQRPAGVIRDNLRANTNLRVALRMADEADSDDVVGSKLAATFDPAIPGRGIVKTGPGRLTQFQGAYVGGWTSDIAPPPTIGLQSFGFADQREWPTPDNESRHQAVDPGANDLQRVVAQIREAVDTVKLPEARKPWLPVLASTFDLGRLENSRRDTELVIGVLDDPEGQRQPTVEFLPDVDGNMVVYGTGGSGKSTFLRTIAASAAMTARGGPCHVYGVDFGGRSLSALEDLPHVGSVISGEDVERLSRLFRELRSEIDHRAIEYARFNASTITEYRQASQQNDAARILVLLDGFAAFRNAYEMGPNSGLYEDLISVAADGRQVGVHVIVTADRPGVIPAALASAIQRRLALRLSNENDLSAADVPKGGFTDDSPPGRGFLDGQEVQIAVLGGSSSLSDQVEALARLARAMRKAGAVEAPAIGRLPEQIAQKELFASFPNVLPTAASPFDGNVLIGMDDYTLGPAMVNLTGSLIVAGGFGSGKSTAVTTLMTSLQAALHAAGVAPPHLIRFGPSRSALKDALQWNENASGPDEAIELAESIRTRLQDGQLRGSNTYIVIDTVSEFVSSSADYPLQDMLKDCRQYGVCVIGVGEVSSLQGSWPLLQALRAERKGLILQPESLDGDSLFGVTLPRTARKDLPPGRGFVVSKGQADRIQVAYS